MVVFISCDLLVTFDTVDHSPSRNNFLYSSLRMLPCFPFISLVPFSESPWLVPPLLPASGMPRALGFRPLVFSIYTHSLGDLSQSHGFKYDPDLKLMSPAWIFPLKDKLISSCFLSLFTWLSRMSLLDIAKPELLLSPLHLLPHPHLLRPIPWCQPVFLSQSPGIGVDSPFRRYLESEPFFPRPLRPLVHTTLPG